MTQITPTTARPPAPETAPTVEFAEKRAARRRPAPMAWFRGDGPHILVFLIPLLFSFVLFSWRPIVDAAVMAFQQTNLVAPPKWVGLDNFATVLQDPLLGTAVLNTLYFAVLALLLGYPIPLFVAVLLSEVRRARGLFSALAYLPVVVPPVVAALLWKFFYDGSPNGVFNTMLGWVGLGPVPWLSDPDWAMPSIVLFATWSAAGGTVIIYLAALVGVAPELYDAAEVDGAGVWRKVWHVTMPQLRGVLLVTFILQIIGTAQVFLEPFLLTGGGPANSTTTVLMLIYRYAFQSSMGGDYGAATALSIMLALVLAVFSAIYFRITKSWSTT
ncbi:sugar ABC transporter permease [Microbacterium sp. NEAU-LLC]|uniref:Sugar ABC transporter permease n=1 Tax=Microbacterium helvum TaxID=2773713 RepID=A0ABR8NSC6_9MICO|nr:sugar ABC transporter permease [Microbacterium helvum]